MGGGWVDKVAGSAYGLLQNRPRGIGTAQGHSNILITVSGARWV